MTTQTRTAQHVDFEHPSETRSFEKGRLDLVEIGGGTVGRLTLEPGWRWSQHVRPIAGTEWCEAPHFQYHATGTLHIKMADGTEWESGQGEGRRGVSGQVNDPGTRQGQGVLEDLDLPVFVRRQRKAPHCRGVHRLQGWLTRDDQIPHVEQVEQRRAQAVRCRSG